MTTEQTLQQHYNEIRRRYCEYAEHTPLASDQTFIKAGLAWGVDQGNQTPSVLLIALEPSHWEYSREDRLDRLNYDLLANLNGDWPVFAHLQDDKNERCFSLFGADGSDGTHSVDSIPPVELMRNFQRLEKDPTFRWSMRIYTRLMHKFDAFHEQVFHTVKDQLNGKNDIIEEVAKLLFLETFRVHHGEDLNFTDHEGKICRFREVFDYRYVHQHGATAVKQIQAAFEAFKGHAESSSKVLIRLIQVCEQMRDYTAAAGYLRHALRIIKESPALNAKRKWYQDLGLW